jgi:glycosyltransferase involved in cell wall biosynthesis
MKPLVSVLIPAFNAQKFIAGTLASALAQTWPRTEIIVVDDGSTDQTLATAKRAAPEHVKIVSQEHQGAAAARNHALRLSQGEYVQWLDADDLLAPDKIERQLSTPDLRPRTLLSCAWGTFICRRSRARFVPTALWNDLSPLEWLLRKMEQNVHMQTATWLVSRELTEAAGPWNAGLSVDDDGEYFCRVLLQAERVRFVPEATVFYRMVRDSLSYIGSSEPKMTALFRSMQLQVMHLRSLEESERSRRACLLYLQNSLSTVPLEAVDPVRRAQELAAGLGGQLEASRLPRKYAWIEAHFGGRLARQARVALPRLRWSLATIWDCTLCRLERAIGGRTPATRGRRVRSAHADVERETESGRGVRTKAEREANFRRSRGSPTT